MAGNGKWIVKLENTNVDPANFQIVDFDFASTVATDDECTAAIIGYLCSCGASDAIAASCSIVEISLRVAGSPGAIPQAFPVAAYAALRAGPNPPPAVAAAFPVGLGTGNLAPLGTSISVSERTGTVGPTGRGRHFLPFASRNAVTAGGSVSGTVRALIETYWGQMINGGNLALATRPVVRPGGVYSGGHLILSVKAQPVFSNLESRRR